MSVISCRYMTSTDFKTLKGNMSSDGKEKEGRRLADSVFSPFISPFPSFLILPSDTLLMFHPPCESVSTFLRLVVVHKFFLA